jgi:quercetin dioxygenase-like cupin family protein
MLYQILTLQLFIIGKNPICMKKFIKISELKDHEIIPGFTARFIHTDKMTVSYWDVKKGSKLPEHSHHHEQISQVMEGKFQLTIEGESMDMQLGSSAVIPSNAVHSGIALTDCKVMDIFAPAREEYMVE